MAEVTVQALQLALKRIKAGWCQGVGRRRADTKQSDFLIIGDEVEGEYEYCAVGAFLGTGCLESACVELDRFIPEGSLNKPDPFHNGSNFTVTRRVVLYNNTHTKEEVVALFEKTLADLGGM